MYIENEQLARSAINCVENVVVSNGRRFDERVWQRTIQLLLNIANATVPHKCVHYCDVPANLSHTAKSVRCALQITQRIVSVQDQCSLSA